MITRIEFLHSGEVIVVTDHRQDVYDIVKKYDFTVSEWDGSGATLVSNDHGVATEQLWRDVLGDRVYDRSDTLDEVVILKSI